MTHERNTEEYQEKAALYALGALSQLEAKMFERHLAEGCSSCDADLLQFEEVVAAIGFSSPEAAPNAHIRSRLLTRIQSEEQIAPQVFRTSDLLRPVQQPKPRETNASFKESSSGRPSSARANLPWAIAAALAAVALVSLFLLNRAGRDADGLRTQLASIENRTRTLEDEAKLERSRNTELAQVNEVLISPQHREIALAGQASAPSASARVYWDLQKSRWVVTADLPPAPSGKVYQLWFVTATDKVSAGLISPDEKGHGFVVTSIPASMGPIAAAAITLEPEGGSKQPTMPIYALGTTG